MLFRPLKTETHDFFFHNDFICADRMQCVLRHHAAVLNDLQIVVCPVFVSVPNSKHYSQGIVESLGSSGLLLTGLVMIILFLQKSADYFPKLSSHLFGQRQKMVWLSGNIQKKKDHYAVANGDFQELNIFKRSTKNKGIIQVIWRLLLDLGC